MTILRDSIKLLLIKYRELIAYGIVGIISVLDSIFWFWLFLVPFGLSYMAANALGWFIDVWIVFVLNKYIVFLSRERGRFWREAWKFISARLASGVLDMLILWALKDAAQLDVMLAKSIDIMIIIIVNYAAAKILVFRKTR
jgi:putative flippase GtrA